MRIGTSNTAITTISHICIITPVVSNRNPSENPYRVPTTYCFNTGYGYKSLPASRYRTIPETLSPHSGQVYSHFQSVFSPLLSGRVCSGTALHFGQVIHPRPNNVRTLTIITDSSCRHYRHHPRTPPPPSGLRTRTCLGFGQRACIRPPSRSRAPDTNSRIGNECPPFR